MVEINTFTNVSTNAVCPALVIQASVETFALPDNASASPTAVAALTITEINEKEIIETYLPSSKR